MSQRKYISIPHWESVNNKSHDTTYYHLIKNSTQQFKNEIHDIYFGKIFRYKYRDTDKIYCNPMGLEATEAQVDSLFRIQNDFGIEISLTINSIETPPELLRDGNVAKEFIAFIKSFYDRGLRSCTIASQHIMRSDILHENFPEMRWKNTVNHRVADAQQVMNYIFCGYDTILLDRSITRNLSELKKIRKAVDHYNNKYKPAKKILTSLLIHEGCLPGCPFKKEHDAIGEQISALYFSTLSKLTCDNWRYAEPFYTLPRNSLNLIASDKETFNEFAALSDIFKYSGRFTDLLFDPNEAEYKQAVWLFEPNKKYRSGPVEQKTVEQTIFSKNIGDVIQDNVIPLHSWLFGFIDTRFIKDDYKNKLNILKGIPNFWKTDKGRRLEAILRNCKSQCWNCHECEKAFDMPHFDSSLQLQASR